MWEFSKTKFNYDNTLLFRSIETLRRPGMECAGTIKLSIQCPRKRCIEFNTIFIRQVSKKNIFYLPHPRWQPFLNLNPSLNLYLSLLYPTFTWTIRVHRVQRVPCQSSFTLCSWTTFENYRFTDEANGGNRLEELSYGDYICLLVYSHTQVKQELLVWHYQVK